MVPRHYEVANAVGAATSGVSVEVEAVIRPGEEGGGYLVHAVSERFEYEEYPDALQKGVEVTRERAVRLIQEQNLEISYISYECRNMYLDKDQIMYEELRIGEDGKVEAGTNEDYGKYLETQIKVLAGGKIFADN